MTTQSTKVKLRQYFICGCLLVSVFCIGAAIGYSSPAMPSMKSPNNKFPVSDEQGALIASIFFVGAIFGSLSAAALIKKYGHKTVSMTIHVILAVGWLLIIVAGSVGPVYVGRIFTGAYYGAAIIVPMLYISEVTTPDIRGTVMSCGQFATTIGTLYAYSLGICLNWRWLAVGIQAVSLIAVVVLIYVPDTPRWYLLHDRTEEAMETLQWLRGEDVQISSEIHTMKMNIEIERATPGIALKDFSTRSFIFPIIIIPSIFVLQQFTGLTVITMNLSELLAEANSRLDPNVESVAVTLVELAGVFPLLILIDKLGRRILLLTSFSICIAMLIILGINDALKIRDPQYVHDNLAWLPIACISIYKFGSSMGVQIPFMLMVELFPARLKEVACSITIIVFHASNFLVPSIYIYIVNGVGYYGMYWIFAGIGVFAMVFVYLVVPETKGRSLEEIEQMIAAKPECNAVIGTSSL